MLSTMNSTPGQEKKSGRKLVFHRVAENLYRLEGGAYYALLKRGDKQFRRSLRTKDRKLAERRLSELRNQVGNLRITEDARLGFPEVTKRWMDATSHTLKESSITRRNTCIANLTPFFEGVSIRNVKSEHCERWLTERASTIAAQTMAHELNTLRAVLDYAVGLGLMLSNPAKGIKRKRIPQAKIEVPTRDQFKKLIETIRLSDGRADSQARAKGGADLVELLAYSGCRIAEANALTWADANFEKNTVTVSGGKMGTKNHESRVIPMTGALRSLLERLKAERGPKPTDCISLHESAKKCLETACRRLGYSKFTHHDFRHYFATTCIEAGVDVPTISRWLGHKDGGALAMRVYGHLRAAHNNAMAGRVVF
jgi:integrase